MTVARDSKSGLAKRTRKTDSAERTVRAEVELTTIHQDAILKRFIRDVANFLGKARAVTIHEVHQLRVVKSTSGKNKLRRLRPVKRVRGAATSDTTR